MSRAFRRLRLLSVALFTMAWSGCADTEVLGPAEAAVDSKKLDADLDQLVPPALRPSMMPGGSQVAYVSNGGLQVVQVVDLGSNAVTATVSFGATAPAALAVSPAGASVYVVTASDEVWVIETQGNTVTTTITGPQGTSDIVVTPDGSVLYVAGTVGEVWAISTATNQVVATVSGFGNPTGLAMTPDGQFVYVVNASANEVSVLATASNTVVATVPVGSLPWDAKVTPSGAHVYVANVGSENVSVVETATNTVIATVPVTDLLALIALTTDGSLAYVPTTSNAPSNDVIVLSTSTNSVVGQVSGFTQAHEIVPSLDGTLMYAIERFSGVKIIDVTTNTIVNEILLGGESTHIAIANVGVVVGSCPAPDLQHWWPGDGNSPNDVIGGSHLSPMSGAGFAPGISGDGFDVSGAGHFTTGAFATPITGDFTVDFWMNPNATTQQDFGSPMASSDNFSILGSFQVEYATNGPQYNVDVYDGSDRSVWFSDPFQASWKHVAVTYDDATQTATVYVDGQLAVAPGGTTSESNPMVLANPMQIDLVKLGINRGNSRDWNGLIDEVHVFDRELTQAEVAGIHLNGCGTPPVLPDLRVDFPGLSGVKVQLRQSDGLPGTFGANIQTLNGQVDQAEITIADGTYDVRVLKGPAELVVDDVVVAGPTIVNGLVSTLTADLEALAGVKIQVRIDDGQPGTFGANVQTLNNQSGAPTVTVLKGSYDIRLLKGPAEHVIDAVDCTPDTCATSDAVGTLSVDLGTLTGIKVQVRIDDGQPGTYGANVQTLNNQTGLVEIPVLKTSYDVRILDGPAETVFDAVDCTGETCSVSMLGATLTVDLGVLTGIKIQVRADDGQAGTYGANIQTLNNQSGVVQIGLLKGSYDIRLLKGPAEQVQDAVDCASGTCATGDADAILSVDLEGLAGVKIQTRIDDGLPGTYGANVQTVNNQSGLAQIAVLKTTYDVRLIKGPAAHVLDSVDCTSETCATSDAIAQMTVDLGALAGVKVQLRVDDGVVGSAGANIVTLNNQIGSSNLDVLKGTYDVRMVDGATVVINDAIDCTGETCFTSFSDAIWAQVESGAFFTCGLDPAGAAHCWGLNTQGQLGDNSGVTKRSTPGPVAGGLTFQWLAGSGESMCALTTGSDLYCWGDNSKGQLGDGTMVDQPTPTLVAGGHLFVSVDSDQATMCGVTDAGDGYCWGDNGWGNVGDGTFVNRNVPTLISGGHQWVDMAAGSDFSCGVTTLGDSYCWGVGSRLGNGSTSGLFNTPQLVSGGHAFLTIDAAASHACARESVGDAYCWGSNQFGQLGDGTTSAATTPTLVQGGHTWLAVVAGHGNAHNCGLTTAGDTYCWGRNNQGQIGDGLLVDATSPQMVSGGLAFAELSPGNWHSCGLTADGKAYCWGDNFQNQLGTGDALDSVTPVMVLDP